MKTKIWFVTVGLVLSSCYNYKHLDLQSDHLKPGEHYKMTTVSDHTWKGKVLAVNDSIITVRSRRGQEIDFPISRLNELQRRKLAVGKTIGLSAAMLGTALGIIALIELSNWDITGLGSIDFQAFSND